MQSVYIFRPGKKIDSVKICKSCKFYEPNRERCKLFGNIDLVTGIVEYNFASAERRDQGQCGLDAKYWEDSYPPLKSLKDAINIEDGINFP